MAKIFRSDTMPFPAAWRNFAPRPRSCSRKETSTTTSAAALGPITREEVSRGPAVVEVGQLRLEVMAGYTGLDRLRAEQQPQPAPRRT